MKSRILLAATGVAIGLAASGFLARLGFGLLMRLADELHLGELPDEHLLIPQHAHGSPMHRAACSCGEWVSPPSYRPATARQHWRDHVRAVES